MRILFTQPPDTMTKTELEKLVTDLLAEVKALRGTVAEMKDAQARQEQMAEEARVRRIMEEAERLRKKALELAEHKGKAADTPKLEEYVEQHNLENLRGISDDVLPALVARSFNPELAQAFAAHQMDMRLFKCVVRYFNVVSKAKPVEVTDELRAEAEQLRAAAAEAEEAKNLLKPTAGEFRLRGRAELQAFFNEQVVDIVNNNKLYAKLGIRFPKAFILEGPPGCGKTFAVERLAEHLGWNTVRIDSSSIGSTYIHATAKKIEESFAEAAKNAPTILIIDEMDAFMPNRAVLSGDNTHSKEEVDSFLKCLQTAEEKRILVVGMTNLISTLDPAVLRTGRMGTHIKVDMPSQAEVEDVLAYALEKRPHAEFPLCAYAGRLLNHPLSDVTHVVDEAAMGAARARRGQIEEADLSQAVERLLQRENGQTAPRKPIGFTD